MKTVYAVRNGKVVDITNEPLEMEEKAFYINKGTGLRWRNRSANKTWVENDKVKKQKRGRELS
jgi:hypothetical protein